MKRHSRTNKLICDRCSKTYKSSLSLKQHVETCYRQNSEAKFQCNVCFKRYRTEVQLTRHCYYAHSERTFPCEAPNCGRAFVSQSHLNAHLVTHTSDRPYMCPELNCGYRARTAGGLIQHKVTHGEGRRFACDYCDYSATTSSNLRRHARIHAGARPYLCPHCDHCTSELDALKKHVLDSGWHPGLPLYVCPWCQPPEQSVDGDRVACVGFNASSLAWRHLVTEHTDALLQSEVYNRISHSNAKTLSERQLIHLHVGQAGVQTANAIWELYCLEHQIQPDGRQIGSAFDHLQAKISAATASGSDRLYLEDLDGTDIGGAEVQAELSKLLPVSGIGRTRDFDNGAHETLFEVSSKGQFVPRAIFIDSESSVIDEVRNGMYRCLFHPHDLITYNEDCSNNFARGNITIGKKMIETIMERIRKAVEHTDLLQGFVATHSCSGGTGSGLTAYIYQCLLADYAKYSVVQLPIYPSSQHANTIVEPYNTVLHLDQAIDAVNLSAMMDNEAIGDICLRNLNHRQPTFHTMNQVIALLTSSLLSPIRYPGCLTAGLAELETNLVPFPRIHFPVLRHAPFLHFSRSKQQASSIDQLVQSVFGTAGQTVKCDLNRGKFMACVLSFRGLIGPRLVNSALTRVKSTPHYEFVDWCPTGVKVNLVAQPPIFVAHDSHIAPTDCSVTMLANSTAIRSLWSMVGAKFDMMFSRRCFIHWFLNEGLEESDLVEARQTLASLEQDYKEIGIGGEKNWNSDQSTRILKKKKKCRRYCSSQSDAYASFLSTLAESFEAESQSIMEVSDPTVVLNHGDELKPNISKAPRRRSMRVSIKRFANAQ